MTEIDCKSERAGIPNPELFIGRLMRTSIALEGESIVERIVILTNSSKSLKISASRGRVRRR
jgi:hypothetical protein